MSKSAMETGLTIRREVLGEETVDNVMKNADDFTRPMQELINEYCWGKVWSRPGLSRKTRSLLNLAMLTVLNRSQELKGHVNGALNNGATVDEIREVFLQAAIYCGVPAAQDGMRVAQGVLKERGVY